MTTRFRSKPRSLRTTWVAPDLQVSCKFFPRPASQMSMSGVCTTLFFEAHRELECWFGLAANAFLRLGCYGPSRIEVSHWRQCVGKGRGKENLRSGLPSLEALRGGHAHTALRYLTASGAARVCGAYFLNNRKEIVFEVSRPLSMWKKRRAASHCPRWNERLLMLPRFRVIDCGMCCVGFDAGITAQLRLLQRCTDPQTSRAVPRTECFMKFLTEHVT